MTWTALDSVGQPDPNAARDAGYSFVACYVGTAYQRYGTSRAYIDRCLGAGIGFWPIFEEWGSQFTGGYNAAVQMMGRMRQGWDRLGLPNDGSCCPAIALVDPTPSAVYGNEGALVAFARGIDDSCWLPSWTGYGSKYGFDVVGGNAPKMRRRWGVGTWGFGERGDGSLPPGVDADMIQHGNKHAQLPGCDENTVFTQAMGQLGGPATTPPVTPRPKEDEMFVMINRDTGEHRLFTALDNQAVDEGYSNELAFAGVPRYSVPANVANSTSLIQYAHRQKMVGEVDAAVGYTPGGGGGQPPDLGTVARDEWANETNRRLRADELAIADGPGATVVVS